jgi:hypothetical protein
MTSRAIGWLKKHKGGVGGAVEVCVEPCCMKSGIVMKFDSSQWIDVLKMRRLLRAFYGYDLGGEKGFVTTYIKAIYRPLAEVAIQLPTFLCRIGVIDPAVYHAQCLLTVLNVEVERCCHTITRATLI